jgi:hypothetical protein
MPRSALVALVLLFLAEAAGSAADLPLARARVQNRTSVPLAVTIFEYVPVGDGVWQAMERGSVDAPAHSSAIVTGEILNRRADWFAWAHDGPEPALWERERDRGWILHPERARRQPRVWRLTIRERDLAP